MKVYIVWMTSVFFLSAEGENYPWKMGDKRRGEKIVFDFLCENGFERTTKTIPVGIFADITFFTPFRGLKVGGEKFSFDLFVKMARQDLQRRSWKEF